MKSLSERLKDWLDIDCAAYEIAVHLGLMEDNKFPHYKGYFWTRNDIGDLCYDTLTKLEEIGVVVHNGDDKYKWNPDFRGVN